jgi:hypothetical protein
MTPAPVVETGLNRLAIPGGTLEKFPAKKRPVNLRGAEARKRLILQIVPMAWPRAPAFWLQGASRRAEDRS